MLPAGAPSISLDFGQISPSLVSTSGLVTYPLELGGRLDRNLVYGVSSNCGNVVTWLRDLLNVPDQVAALGARMDQGLAETDPGADGLHMLPYLAGERSPIWDPSATGVLAGLTSRHGGSHVVRAALEGVAFNLRRIVELFGDVHGPVYRAVGGPAQLDAWTQMKADVLNVRIELAAARHAAPLGAAMLAAVGIGWYPHLDAAAAAMTAVSRVVEPDDSRRDAYEDAYGSYLERADIEEHRRGMNDR